MTNKNEMRLLEWKKFISLKLNQWTYSHCERTGFKQQR